MVQDLGQLKIVVGLAKVLVQLSRIPPLEASLLLLRGVLKDFSKSASP